VENLPRKFNFGLEVLGIGRNFRLKPSVWKGKPRGVRNRFKVLGPWLPGKGKNRPGDQGNQGNFRKPRGFYL